jgi:hypothetical protein
MGSIRFGSKADIRTAQSYVRFTPNSGHVRRTSRCPLSANSGQSMQAGHSYAVSPVASLSPSMRSA